MANAPVVEEPAAAVAQVEENIKPVAVVELAAADAGPHVDKSGEEVVAAVCGMCHTAGLMNAPKIGDKAQWAPRIAQGYDTLVSNAINGIRSMPARGGNPSLTDGEVASAVVNMANASGANFKVAAPKAESPSAVVATAATATSAVAAETKAIEPATTPDAALVSASATPAAGKSGKEVYEAVCAMCHGTGLMNAPKFADKAQWGPRIKQGQDTLVSHAVKGIRMMPAKGGNAGLSDAEVTSAVKYMANAAGASY